MSRKRSARSSKYAAPEMMYHVCRGKAVGDGMDYQYRLQRYSLATGTAANQFCHTL